MNSATSAGYDISLRTVSMSYRVRGSPFKVIDNFSLDVKENEFVSLVGPSGCGKTTILKMIAGIVPEPTAGSVSIRGESVDSAVRKREIGMVFQRPSLMPWRTVLNNVLLPFEIRGSLTPEDVERAKTILDFMGLGEFEESYPETLSGGMQHRVGIARALAFDPRVLLMDEPFAALDAITRQKLGVELLKIWTRFRKTVVFVTHDISEALLLSDRIIVLSGRPAHALKSIDVEITRPRNTEIEDSRRFLAYRKEIRSLLEISS